MADIILAVLCLIVGGAFALLTILAFWAGALEQAATGSSDGHGAIWFAIIALAGIGGGISILVF